MLFNTVDFGIFLPLVLFMYWILFSKKLVLQNIFIVVVSYLFYAFWDWRFLGLIMISSLIDYYVGQQLVKTDVKSKKKWLLFFSLSVNLGMLCYFKYANFFIEAFQDTFRIFGTNFNEHSLNIILPVGISFYTFQTLSYTIDVYRNRIAPTNNIVAFFAFVSFFSQLVAGPIERAKNLLPQFEKERVFNYAKSVDGLRLILLGLFKKMVIADNCAIIVNDLFASYADHSGSTLLFGAVFFAFQIYGDFSGYSDIAIGTARLLGFDLMKNFNFPYLSRNLSEFWRRWHISLSTWFRDYVYIPLGGSKTSKLKQIRNIFIVFLVSGFWHGANYTFIAWGAFHALLFIPLILRKKNQILEHKFNLNTILNIAVTFFLVVIGWVFFRAETMSHAIAYLEIVFSKSLFTVPRVTRLGTLLLFLYIIAEWVQRNRNHLLDISYVKSKAVRYSIYYVLILVILYFAGVTEPFIYFQF